VNRLAVINVPVVHHLVDFRIVRFVIDAEHGGYGVIVVSDGCPPDKVAVRLGNGNTWHYPWEEVRRVPSVKLLSFGTRRTLLHARGYRLLSMIRPRQLP
jgi:hypothetical protein